MKRNQWLHSQFRAIGYAIARNSYTLFTALHRMTNKEEETEKLEERIRRFVHSVNSPYYTVVSHSYFVITPGRCLSLRLGRFDGSTAEARPSSVIDGIGNYGADSRTYLPTGGRPSASSLHAARGNRLPAAL